MHDFYHHAFPVSGQGSNCRSLSTTRRMPSISKSGIGATSPSKETMLTTPVQ